MVGPIVVDVVTSWMCSCSRFACLGLRALNGWSVIVVWKIYCKCNNLLHHKVGNCICSNKYSGSMSARTVYSLSGSALSDGSRQDYSKNFKNWDI